MKHTAKILNPVMIYGAMIGTIYDDSRGKFPDGTDIRSSTVVNDYHEGGVRFIETRNSIYEVIEEVIQDA
jgi:hypothetical protein